MWKMWKKSSNRVAKNSKFNQNIEIIYTVTVGLVRCDKLGLKNVLDGIEGFWKQFFSANRMLRLQNLHSLCVGNWFIVSVMNGDTVGFWIHRGDDLRHIEGYLGFFCEGMDAAFRWLQVARAWFGAEHRRPLLLCKKWAWLQCSMLRLRVEGLVFDLQFTDSLEFTSQSTAAPLHRSEARRGQPSHPARGTIPNQHFSLSARGFFSCGSSFLKC